MGKITRIIWKNAQLLRPIATPRKIFWDFLWSFEFYFFGFWHRFLRFLALYDRFLWIIFLWVTRPYVKAWLWIIKSDPTLNRTRKNAKTFFSYPKKSYFQTLSRWNGALKIFAFFGKNHTHSFEKCATFKTNRDTEKNLFRFFMDLWI